MSKTRKRYTPADAAAIGHRLAAARARVELSLRELADGIPSCSGAYLSRIELGERRPSHELLQLLAPRLGVSAAWLETGRDVVELELPRTLLLSVRKTSRRRELVAAIDVALVTAGVPPVVRVPAVGRGR